MEFSDDFAVVGGWFKKWFRHTKGKNLPPSPNCEVHPHKSEGERP